jgi:hypothetical protein
MKSMGDKVLGIANRKPRVPPTRELKYDGPIRTTVLSRYALPASAADSKIMRVAQPQDKLPGGLCDRGKQRGRK